MKEITAAKASELNDGDIKTVSADGHKILLSKIGGKVYANTGVCPHYGADLGDGICDGNRVVCPWHHAAFDITTGRRLEPPALDGLVSLEVRERGDDIVVLLPDDVPSAKQLQMAKCQPDKDARVFMILGAGAAGSSAAQTLRENGYRGRILMITQEDRLPYDRPNLSKDYLQGEAEEEWMPLRPAEFYENHDIELRQDSRVVAVDVDDKRVQLEDGDQLSYDQLLLAVGGRPRRLRVQGADIDGVYTLRSYENADEIIKAVESARKALVVGAGFIGMEAAFSLKKRGLDVTVVAPEEEPLAAVFGTRVGALFRKRHEDAGVRFRLGRTVKRFQGKERVEKAILDNGDGIETDLTLIGVDVDPATDLIKGIMFERDGSVRVDEYLQAYDGIHAAGDIACFPDKRTGRHTRIEHWRTAQQQGQVAARNMLGGKVPYDKIPFFWTSQAGLHLRYVGHAEEWDEIITEGDVMAADFVAYYVRDGKVLAAAGNNRDKELAAAEVLMREDRLPLPDELRSSKVRLNERVER
jgi:NADPH-dependent 2,4-dienoyl-CoA reductase/sulfur reductase-like enzyme/nitrite reductase/ring-hydroxylating ferredoxin subunit